MHTHKQSMQEGSALIGASVLLTLAFLPAEKNLLEAAFDSAFGLAAWWWPPFLADLGWGRLQQRRAPLRLLKAIALLLLACLLLDWGGGAGGRLGAAVGGILVRVLGLGAYALIGAALWWIARQQLRHTQFAFVVHNSRLRLSAAWQASGVRELEQQARLHAPQEVAAPLPRLDSLSHEAIVIEEVGESYGSAPIPAATSRSEPPPLPVLQAKVPTQFESPAKDTPPDPAPVEVVKPRVTAKAAYAVPPVGLLKLGDPVPTPDARALTRVRMQLEEQLAGFGVRGTIDGLTNGPVLATYEFQPAPGTKIAKIKNLGDDLAMAVARGVRVIAPLPNTGRVGLEVPYPQANRATISLRELLDHPEWAQFSKTASLPLALGKDARGQPVCCDLARAPHLLVAGTTGSGKSVSLNVMLMSLLLSCSPLQLRLLLIDPKIVELGVYADIPHLYAPVVNEMTEASAALVWAVGEMERRYQLMADADVNELEAYNAIAGTEALPRIVVVIDEFGDLMLAHAKQVEPLLARLAQKARAAGIHLLLATQRPSADVITGLIKANLPSRCALKVTSNVNSRVILDEGGAEHLLGRGDALCLLPGSLDLQRVHGAFVSRDEVRSVCSFLRAQECPQYIELPRADALERNATGSNDSSDSLYARALKLVQEQPQTSISHVQRKLKVGYNRAAELIERLEEEGVVGPEKVGGGKRDVLRQAS